MPSPLHHLVEGSGPAVVLLHAGVADLRMWDHQVAALSSDHRVVRCDLRGFGQSPLRADDSYSDAEDILALLDELGVAEFALVGASHGGGVALQVASAVPERVTRLVLLDAAAGVAEKTDAIRAVWAEEERLVSAEDIDGATELMVRTWLDRTPTSRHARWYATCSGVPTTCSWPRETTSTTASSTSTSPG